tara:strand:+ start:839 stop:2809 length:1971 start_codon:yes stop_codon:yes gene_type:complete
MTNKKNIKKPKDKLTLWDTPKTEKGEKFSGGWSPRPPTNDQKKSLFLHDFEIFTTIQSKKSGTQSRTADFSYEVKLFYFDKSFLRSNKHQSIKQLSRVEQVVFARNNAKFTHRINHFEASKLFLEISKRIKDRFKHEKFIKEWDNVINSAFINHLNHIEQQGKSIDVIDKEQNTIFDKKTPNQILNEIIKKKNLTPKEIAVGTGLNEATIYRHIQNTLDVNRQTAKDYAKFFGMDPSEILFNDIEIPLKGYVDFSSEGEAFDIEYIMSLYSKDSQKDDQLENVFKKIEIQRKIQLIKGKIFPGRVKEQELKAKKREEFQTESLDSINCPRDIYRPDVEAIRVTSSECSLNNKDIFYYKENEKENLKNLTLCVFEIDANELRKEISEDKIYMELLTQNKDANKGADVIEVMKQMNELIKYSLNSSIFVVGHYKKSIKGITSIYSTHSDLITTLANTKNFTQLKILINLLQNSIVLENVKPINIFPVVAVLDSKRVSKKSELRSQLIKQSNLTTNYFNREKIDSQKYKKYLDSIEKSLKESKKISNETIEQIENIKKRQLENISIRKRYRPDLITEDGKVVEFKSEPSPRNIETDFSKYFAEIKKSQAEFNERFERNIDRGVKKQELIARDTFEFNKELKYEIEKLKAEVQNLKSKDD